MKVLQGKGEDRFSQEREAMVQEQLITRGIHDGRVLEAFRKVKRELFVPENMVGSAYDDSPLPIGEGQTISQPYMVALMTEALGLKGGEKVLEIGTGSGYQTAILCELARDVYSVERLPTLAERARKILEECGYRVHLKVGDGSLGWPEFAPYEAIVVTAGGPKIPESLLRQLKDGGRLVMPVGDRFIQELLVVTRSGQRLEKQSLGGCKFVPLKGKEGWDSTGEEEYQ
ncbi:MAG TPA: protein-L-isoaspartate(D-aspartate) O-methyltransferase [bacterium]|nr:protein-L-isoaspartate(D-aspartate) O-methyltransferase [bacterium]HOL66105.1 protein-L-isoaspartate(D-aspartate) O-methyltransferase [bacterium]HPP11174.1 protein-L-isoaspartate(D-aspartate) O-methyltransferase [bacterium]